MNHPSLPDPERPGATGPREHVGAAPRGTRDRFGPASVRGERRSNRSRATTAPRPEWARHATLLTGGRA